MEAAFWLIKRVHFFDSPGRTRGNSSQCHNGRPFYRPAISSSVFSSWGSVLFCIHNEAWGPFLQPYTLA